MTYRDALKQFERQYLIQALKAHNYNQCKTAAALGFHRNTLSRHLLNLGIWLQERRQVRGNRHAH